MESKGDSEGGSRVAGGHSVKAFGDSEAPKDRPPLSQTLTLSSPCGPLARIIHQPDFVLLINVA